MFENPEVTTSSEPAELLVSTAQMCQVLGFKASITLGKLERAGWIKRTGKNQWRLGETVAGVLKSVRESRHAAVGQATLQLRQAQLQRIEAANARDARERIRMVDAVECIEVFGGSVITELCGLPARVSRNLHDRSTVAGEVFAMRTRIADKMKAMAQSLAGEAAK